MLFTWHPLGTSLNSHCHQWCNCHARSVNCARRNHSLWWPAVECGWIEVRDSLAKPHGRAQWIWVRPAWHRWRYLRNWHPLQSPGGRYTAMTQMTWSWHQIWQPHVCEYEIWGWCQLHIMQSMIQSVNMRYEAAESGANFTSCSPWYKVWIWDMRLLNLVPTSDHAVRDTKDP